MATQRQLRRGTEAENDAFTGAEGELVQDTDNNRVIVHDGATTGGFPVPNHLDAQRQTYTFSAAGGTANALTATTDRSPGTLQAGTAVELEITATNTSSSTLNWNATGVKNIKKFSDGAKVDVDADDLEDGNILKFTYDGTDYIVSLGGSGVSSGQWEDITITNATATSTISFSGFDSAKYNEYRINFDEIKPATTNTILHWRVNTISTGTYRYGIIGSDAGTAGVIASNATGATSGNLTRNSVGNGSANSLSGQLYINGAHDTALLTLIRSFVGYLNNGGNPEQFTGEGANTTTADITSIEFFWSSGNFAANGTITFQGKVQ